MSHCTRCDKQIFGDDLYELKGKVYCEVCASELSRESMSASPTGFGCIGSYIARKEYLRNDDTTTSPVKKDEDKA